MPQPMPSPKRDAQQKVHAPSGIAAVEITRAMRQILEAPAFQKSKRLTRFLSFAVERTLAGEEAALKELVLGVEVFDRGPAFDPRVDPIVRIDARRLRARVTEYYQADGADDPIVIEFEPGSYVPKFRLAGESAVGPALHAPIHAPKPIRKVLALDMLRRARRELLDVPTVEGVFKALQLFRRAAETNPDHAVAHLGIAVASIWTPVLGCESPHIALPRAKRAAQRAIELDPVLPEAHAVLAMVSATYDHDFGAANTTLLLAGRLNPKAAIVQQARATVYLAPIGRLAEAAEAVEAALQAQPLARFRFSLGWIRYLQRDWSAAADEMRETLRAAPEFLPARYFLSLASERLGQSELAKSALDANGMRAAYPLLADRVMALEHLREGRREATLAVARAMEAAYTAGSNDPLQIAEVYAALGEAGSAIEWLHRAYEDRRTWLIYLNSDPAYDAIRDEPRFRALAARMGL